MKSLLTIIFLISTPLFAQNTAEKTPVFEKSPEQVNAELLVKNREFKKALPLLEKLISAAKSETPAQISNTHGLMRSNAYVHLMTQQRDKAKKLTEDRYAFITEKAAKFPDDLNLAKLRLLDLSRVANQLNIFKENDKRLALNLEATTLAETLLKAHPENQEVKLAAITAYTDLGKTYRWNKNQREKCLPLVEKGMQVVDSLDAEKLPNYLTIENMSLQLLRLRVDVISLKKEYAKALEASTDLLAKTKPMLSKDTPAHVLTGLFSSLYHHAFLHEKLGKPAEAQMHLQSLIDTIDQCLKKDPENAQLLRSKNTYTKLKGKPLR